MTDPVIRRIATEEAFATRDQLKQLGRVAAERSDADALFWRGMFADPDDRRVRDLLDIGDARIADMDANGVDVQLLSLTSPGVQMFDADTACGIAASANDELAEAVRRHPARLAGLAALAPQDPARAVKEMERGINALGLHGFIINSHTDGEYLDLPKYWPILEAAEALGRPIYLHPRTLPEAAAGPYMDHMLWTAMWGYAAETGLHGMRLLVSGMFDRFPKLKIALGHMGEGIPYFAYRIDHMHAVMQRGIAHKLALKPSDYLRRNFLITTSGMNHHPALDYCVRVLGTANILWAIDYPYQRSDEAVAFMDTADLSGPDLAAIYGGNAAREFRIA